MKTVSVPARDSNNRNPQVPGAALEREAHFLAALKLFEAGSVSTAKAAEMCGMASVDFLLAAERSNQPTRHLTAP